MVRFDTRDRKPKIYDIAVLTAAVFAFLGILVMRGSYEHVHLISCILIAYLAAVIVLLIRAFIRQLRYNPYSYNTIYYIGFAIFVLFLLLTQIILAVRLSSYTSETLLYNITGTLLASARNYMIMTSPFVLVFSIGLCISNVSLIRHEDFRFVNILGIILSVLLVGGIAFIWTFDFYASGSLKEIMIHELWTSLFAAVYLYFECMLIGVIISHVIVCRYEPDHDKDFMIILGCAIRKDGTPSPILKGRIDRALDFYHKQKDDTGRELTFVTSGGQGPDEVISESRSMKNYLMDKGIKEEQIVMEDRSTSTYENMKFSKEKIEAIDPEGKIAFSTTNFHVFRSGLLARRVKMKAQGIGADTKWYFWPNATVREFVGLLTAHRLKQAVILTVMIAVYILLVSLHYSY